MKRGVVKLEETGLLPSIRIAAYCKGRQIPPKIGTVYGETIFEVLQKMEAAAAKRDAI